MNVFKNYTENDIVSIAQIERFHHPKSNLTDYYKLFYQSFYGQGHFICDDFEAERHLVKELLSMCEAYKPILQDISNENGLFRVSLQAIKTDAIPLDDLLLLYMDSKFIQTDWHQWSDSWITISGMLFDLYPELADKMISLQCAEVIKNKAIISHSECFRLTYSPHYRVMQLSELDLLKHPDLRNII